MAGELGLPITRQDVARAVTPPQGELSDSQLENVVGGKLIEWTGSDGNDKYAGSNYRSTYMDGGDADDTVYGGQGEDTIYGGDDDVTDFNPEEDRLFFEGASSADDLQVTRTDEGTVISFGSTTVTLQGVDLVFATTAGMFEAIREIHADPKAFRVAYEVREVDLYVAVSAQTGDEQVRQWREAFESMREDGTFQRIYRKWYPDRTPPLSPAETLP